MLDAADGGGQGDGGSVDRGKVGWDGAVVAVLGLFDKGKTFVLNQLTESDLPSGKKVSTKGLSFKHVDVEGTKFVVLDSEGSYAPVKVGWGGAMPAGMCVCWARARWLCIWLQAIAPYLVCSHCMVHWQVENELSVVEKELSERFIQVCEARVSDTENAREWFAPHAH